jgi:hypothetical protein
MRTGWLTQVRRSVLGPQPTGEPRTPVHSGVRVSPPSCPCPSGSAHKTVVTEDGLPYGRAGSRHQQVEPSPLSPGRATHVQCRPWPSDRPDPAGKRAATVGAG